MNSIFKTLIVLLSLALPALAADKQLCGGYSPMAADSKDVAAAAAFAVSAQSQRDKTPIKLITISQAEKQVVAGVNYRLTLIVGQGALNRTVKAVVFQNLKSKYSLTSWEPL